MENSLDRNMSMLRWVAERYCSRYFDNMPVPPIRIGHHDDFDTELAHYDRESGVIEVSPERVLDAFRLQEINDTIKHELIHAWTDWKGIPREECGGHGKWFLWKAHQIGVDVEYLLDDYPELEDYWEQIQSGYKPREIVDPEPSPAPPPPLRVFLTPKITSPGPGIIDVADLPFGDIPDLKWGERYITEEDYKCRSRTYQYNLRLRNER